MKLYTTVFGVRNIPLLEVAYALLNADLEAAMKDLLSVMEEKHTTITPCEEEEGPKKDQRSLSPYEAQGAVIFDLSILSQLSTTAKSVMGVSRCNSPMSTYVRLYVCAHIRINVHMCVHTWTQGIPGHRAYLDTGHTWTQGIPGHRAHLDTGHTWTRAYLDTGHTWTQGSYC